MKDYLLGRPITLWRLRHPQRGEVVCLIAQPRSGRVELRLLRDGKVCVQRWAHALDVALRWADDTRAQVTAHEWMEG